MSTAQYSRSSLVRTVLATALSLKNEGPQISPLVLIYLQTTIKRGRTFVKVKGEIHIPLKYNSSVSGFRMVMNI